MKRLIKTNGEIKQLVYWNRTNYHTDYARLLLKDQKEKNLARS